MRSHVISRWKEVEMPKTAVAAPAAPRGRGTFVLFTQEVLVARVSDDRDQILPPQTDYIQVTADASLIGWCRFTLNGIEYRWPLACWKNFPHLGVKVIRQ